MSSTCPLPGWSIVATSGHFHLVGVQAHRRQCLWAMDMGTEGGQQAHQQRCLWAKEPKAEPKAKVKQPKAKAKPKAKEPRAEAEARAEVEAAVAEASEQASPWTSAPILVVIANWSSLPGHLLAHDFVVCVLRAWPLGQASDIFCVRVSSQQQGKACMSEAAS